MRAHFYFKRIVCDRKRGIIGEAIGLAVGIAALAGLAATGGAAAAGAFSKPKDSTPPALQPLPTAPTQSDAEATIAAESLAKRRSAAAGGGNTFLTSPLGDPGAVPSQGKTLLGS